MADSLFNYLLESSICLVLFVATYRIMLADKTNFTWMRFYLLASMVLSIVLPLIIIPIEWSAKLIPGDSLPMRFFTLTESTRGNIIDKDPNLIQTDTGISLLGTTLFVVIFIYALGFIYKSYLLVRNLTEINALIEKSPKVKEDNHWIVCLKNETPAFSFFNYIFINENYNNFSSGELNTIKKHELVHVKQYHTLDILFVELVGIVFWFNPIVNYMRKSLKEIHEYIVDEKIAGQGENKKTYAQLLLTLATDAKTFDLTASFAGESIQRRILMLAKPRTSAKSKLMFLVLIPLAALLSLSFSCLKNPDTHSNRQAEVARIQVKLKKYCGLYVPSKNAGSILKPMEIIFKDNKLFSLMETKPESANNMVELHFESDSIFSFADNSARCIQFNFDAHKKVSGCGLVKYVTKEDRNYLVLEGEYAKR